MKRFIRILPLAFIAIGYVHADNLADISLNFCDTPENTLQYQIDPGAETGICYTLSNGGKNTVTVKLSFVDGTFTNDERQNKACLSDTDTENFWRYITEYDTLITLKPGESMRKEAKLMYPQGMDGLYYGCVVYSLVERQQNGSAATTSFTVLMRRAKFIDVIVGDPANAKERGIILEEFTGVEWANLSHNPLIRIYQDESDGRYMMQIKVRNVSRTQQDIVITWTAANIIGQKLMFVEPRKILRNETLLITKKIDKDFLYNMNLRLNISNTPMTFWGETPAIGHLKQRMNIMIRDTITFITMIGLLLVIGIIFLLVKDIRKKGKAIQTKIPPKKPEQKKTVKGATKYHAKKK